MADEITSEDAVRMLLQTPDEQSEQTPDEQATAEAAEQPEESAEAQEAEAVEEEGSESEPDPLLEAEPDTEAEDSEQELYEVTANGETLKVTLDELAKGYSREQDYTRKTEDLAREREAIEAERKTIAEQVETERQQLQAYYTLVQTIGPEPQPPNVELYNEDPEEYREQKERFEVLKAQWDKSAGDVVAAEEKRVEEWKGQYEQYKAAELQKLQAAWPELKDPEKAQAINTGLTRFLTDQGFSSDEIGQMVDSRFLIIARDAYRYRQSGNAAKNKVRDVPKVQKPGAKPDKPDIKAREAAFLAKAKAKPGGLTIEDATRALLGNV